MNPQQTQPNTQQQGQQDPLSGLAMAVTKAIGYTENGGAPDISNPSSGKTGEMKSIFQYEPETWKLDAEKILGNPNAPLTPDNETQVAYQTVLGDLKNGDTVSQIASSWNAGPAEKNAYTGKFSDGSSSVGVNPKYGVKYDVPSYAKKVLSYTKQFLGQGGQSQQISQPKQDPTKNQPLSSNPPLKKALTMIKTANNNAKKKKSRPQGQLGSGSGSTSSGGFLGGQLSLPPLSSSPSQPV